MSEVPRKLILASTSPRRRELLHEAGFAPQVASPGVDEDERAGETPEQHVRRLALAKARAVAERVTEPACVLGADTVVVLGERMLGKPRDAEHAQAMLLALAGRTHRVLSGFALLTRGPNGAALREESGVEESRVTLREITPAEARAYAKSGEPLDKAGAYAAQGAGGRFVESIAGSRSNVIGLPLEAILPRLRRLGVECPR